MSPESRRLAGILLILLPTVIFGGVSILSLIITDPAYMENELRQDLWRAGHAHAGVLLILSLVALRYVDEARLSRRSKSLVRTLIPTSAILLPAAFFLSVLNAEATEPNGFIYLAYVGAVVLSIGLVMLGVGLIRAPGKDPSVHSHPLGAIAGALIVASAAGACTFSSGEADAIRATAVRYFLTENALLADSLSLAVEGEHASEALRRRLSDLEIHLIASADTADLAEHGDALPHLSVRRLRWKWVDRAAVQVSIFIPPHAAYGAKYLLRRMHGAWRVVRVDAEWMT